MLVRSLNVFYVFYEETGEKHQPGEENLQLPLYHLHHPGMVGETMNCGPCSGN